MQQDQNVVVLLLIDLTNSHIDAISGPKMNLWRKIWVSILDALIVSSQ